MALNLLKQLRSIEEKGALPPDSSIQYAGREVLSTNAALSRVGKGQVSQRMRSADSESKDELSQDQLARSHSEILSIVDDPYSNNDLLAHKQHSLSCGLLKQLLNTGSAGAGYLPRSGSLTSFQKKQPPLLQLHRHPHEPQTRDAEDHSVSSWGTQTSYVGGPSSASASASAAAFLSPGASPYAPMDRSVEKAMLSKMTGASRKASKAGSVAVNPHEWNRISTGPLLPISTGKGHGQGQGLQEGFEKDASAAQSAFLNSLLEREKTRNGHTATAIIGATAKDSYIHGLAMYSVSAVKNVPPEFDRENDIHSLHSVDSKDSTVQAFRQAVKEREKYAVEMNKVKDVLNTDLLRSSAVIDSRINKAVDFLPTDLLIKHGKFELVRERALTKMWGLLVRMRLALMRMAKRRWVNFVLSTNESIMLAAGAHIVRVARGCLGRMRYRRIRKEHLENERLKGRVAAVKGMGIVPRVILIQSAIRRFKAKLKVAPLLKTNRAAKFVQMFIRSRIIIIIARRALRKKAYERDMAILIQKTVRARRGRKRFRKFRKEHNHALMKLKYETNDSTFKWYFEQNGSAAKIQHWFRNLPWYVKLKWTRVYSDYYKHRKAIWVDTTGRLVSRKRKKKKKKKRAGQTGKDAEYDLMAQKRLSQNEKMTDIADLLNHVVRGFLGRWRVKHMREEIQRLINLRYSCATIIQKTIRRVLVAMKMPLVGTRTRSLQKKYHKWRSSENFRIKQAEKTRREALRVVAEEEEAEKERKRQSRSGSRGSSREGVRSAAKSRSGSVTSGPNGKPNSRPNSGGSELAPAKLSSRVGSSTSVASRRKTPTVPEAVSRIGSATSARSRPGSTDSNSRKRRPLVKWWVDTDQHLYIPPPPRGRKMEDVVTKKDDPANALRPLHRCTRRNSIDLGVHFKILKAKEIPKMNAAARCIARSYKCSHFRWNFAVYMLNKSQVYATKLQNWGVYMTLRRRIIRLRNIIKQEGGLWDRVLQRRTAAAKIQRRYRTHASMVWLRNFKAKRVKGIAQLFRFYYRRIKANRAVKEQINYRRSLLESSVGGQQQYERTVIFAHIDAFWEGAKQIKSLNVTFDLQKFFQGIGSGGMLESSRFAKVLQLVAKDSDLFGAQKKKGKKKGGKDDDKNKPLTPPPPASAADLAVKAMNEEEEIVEVGTPLDSKVIETMFLKVKALNDKRIDYPCWLDLLCNLAAIRYLGLSESLLPTGEKLAEFTRIIQQINAKPGSGQRGSLSSAERNYEYDNLIEDGAMSQEQIDMIESINNFSYGRYTGRPALISKFCMDYIALSADYKKVVLILGKKASQMESEKLVSTSLATLQIWAKNRVGIKRIRQQWHKNGLNKVFKQRYKAATLINAMVKSFLGRIHIMKMAQNIYSKFLDQESGAVYWFNPRTERAFWTKPILLGSKDCGNPVSMPHSDEQYIVLCSLCDPDDNPNSATTFCDECDDVYCPNCYKVAHKSAKMAGHKTIPLTLCVQCDFQAASRRCVQCKDVYCDNCYKVSHAKGRLKLHIYQTCTQQCQACDDRAAQWTYHPNNGEVFEEGYYCVPCTRTKANLPTEVPIRATNVFMEVEGQPSLSRFKFKGASVLDFRGARDEANRRAALAEDFARRKKEQHEIKIHRAATNIQRNWRGHKDRKDIVDFQRERREFFTLRQQQMSMRDNLIYKFLAYWGVAPNMASDTLLERVLNSYPVHMHDILEESINSKWKIALKLQREQDEHMEKVGNPSKVLTFMKQMDAKKQTKKFKQAEAKLARKLAELEASKIKYREYRARSDAKKDQIAALIKSAEEAAKTAEKAVEEKKKAEEEMKEANDTVTDFIGPRGLKTLVESRRRDGILMPFRVHMTQGSRIAQVTWEPVPDYAAIARAKAAAEEAAELAAIEAAKEAEKLEKKNKGKKGKEAAAAVAAPVEKVEEEYKSMQRKFLDKLRQEKLDILAYEDKRRPVIHDGVLELDDEGMAVDYHGNKLEVNQETGAPIIPPWTPPEPPSPGLTDPNYGTWVKLLKEHDLLLIKGGSFQVISRDEFIQDMKDHTEKEKEVEKEKVKGEGDDDEEEEEEEEEEEKEEEDIAVVAIDEDDIDYQDTLHMKIDLGIMQLPHSDDFICMDRPWVLPDADYEAVSKMIPPKFYIKPFKKLGKRIVCSYVPQKAIQIAAINAHMLAKLNRFASRLFDSESDMGAWFIENAENMDRRKWSLVKQSREVVHFSFDFTARRTLFRKVRDQVGVMKRSIMLMRNRAMAAAGDESAGLSFEFWDASEKKTPITIFMDLGLRGEVKLGIVEMDMSAPILLMREYIHRQNEIRETLNSTYQGDNFQFFVVKENEKYDGKTGDPVIDWVLEKEEEKMTFTSDFSPFKIDSKTMEGINRCSIVLDKVNTAVVKIKKKDKHGNEILEQGDEGYDEWVKEQAKLKKAAKHK